MLFIRHRVRRLVACATIIMTAVSICACSAVNDHIAAGIEYEHAAIYRIRSPEYVVRDLGSQRYLIGQQLVNSGGRSELIRYVDLANGIATRIDDRIRIFRSANYRGDVPIHYASDDPMTIVFAERGPRDDNWLPGCGGSVPYAERLKGHCAVMDIVLSLDAGRTFATAQLRIPSVLRAEGGEDRYAFLVVRQQVLYIGLYMPSIDGYLNDHANAVQRNRAGVAIARFRESPEIGYESLVVLSMPLPSGQLARGPAAPPLVADRVVGEPLESFLIPATMKTIQERIPKELVVPYGAENKRSIRKQYVESLRSRYPEWAGSQDLDIPEETLYETKVERTRRFEKMAELSDDPPRWVDYQRVLR